MSYVKSADEYWRLAARARAGAWGAGTLDVRAAFLQTEASCELMAHSVENLEELRDLLADERLFGPDLLCSRGRSI